MTEQKQETVHKKQIVSIKNKNIVNVHFHKLKKQGMTKMKHTKQVK